MVGGIEVGGSVQVGTVVAHQLLVELHDQGVLMSIAGGLQEDSGVEIGHLVVPHEDEGRSVVGLVGVGHHDVFSALELSEGLLSQLLDGVGLDSSSGHNYQVVTGLMGTDPILQHLAGDIGHVFSDSEKRLANLVVSVRGEHRTLKSDAHLVSLLLNDLSVNGLSLGLDLVLLESRVLVKVPHDLEDLSHIGSFHCNGDSVPLSVGRGVYLSAEGGQLALDVTTGSGGGSAEPHLLEEVHEAGRLGCFVTGSEAPVEAKTGLGGTYVTRGVS